MFDLRISSASFQSAYAQIPADYTITDYGKDPEIIADAIVTFIPSKDLPLHIPLEQDRILEGEIGGIEMGLMPRAIIMHADTMIRPLFAGVPVRMILKEERELEGVYYPIAIYTPKGDKK